MQKSGVIFLMESRLENKEGETIKDEWHVFVQLFNDLIQNKFNLIKFLFALNYSWKKS